MFSNLLSGLQFFFFFFDLLKLGTEKATSQAKQATDSENTARKSYVHEFFLSRVRDLAYIGRDRICCFIGGEPYYNHCFYEEQLSSQKKLVLGY